MNSDLKDETRAGGLAALAPVPPPERLEALLADCRRDPDNPHNHCFQHAALWRGLATDTVVAARRPGEALRTWVRLVIGGRVHYFANGALRSGLAGRPFQESRHVNGRTVELTTRKHATKVALEALGAPVPVGALVPAGRTEEALEVLRRLGRPVCVKPDRGTEGSAVRPAIDDEATFREAFQAASAYGGPVLVEEHVSGHNVRFFYVRPGIVAVRFELPANVVGDGRHSVGELVAFKNAERLRRALPRYQPVPIGPDTPRILARQGLDFGSRPEAGRRVVLSLVSNVSAGGDAIATAGGIHPAYAALVARVCAAMDGLKIAAVDTVIGDPAAPPRRGAFWILEINSSPGVAGFYFPWEGEARDVAGPVLDRLIGGGPW
jgi:D-alanine-D-alanine ligase-like ATP-grasp enzyme